MKTISKGQFVVIKRTTEKKRTFCENVARGTKKECMQYIIEFANETYELCWSSNVHLSLHVFPNDMRVYFHIVKYNRNQTESLRIEYEIAKYTEQ